MIRKRRWTMSVIISVSAAVVLSGCAGQSEPDVAKTNYVNQSLTNSVNSNVAANRQNTAVPVASNTQPPIVNNDKKPVPAVKEPTPQIGSGGGDMFLFTQVRSALSSEKELFNAVIIELKDGNATLTGSVPNEALKAKAAQLVQSVKGIKSVKNNLRVSS